MTSVTFFDIKPLQTALENNELIITANQRLCNKVKAAWAEHQQLQGRTAWPTPSISAYTPWLHKQWFELQSQLYDNSHRLTLLSDDKELWLWQRIIAESELGQSLLLVRAAAEAAKQAYGILSEWQIKVSDSRLHTTTDTEAYLNWHQAFDKLCESRQLISSSLLPNTVTAAYCDQVLAQYETLHLLGFDDLSPRQHALFTQASKRLNFVEPKAIADKICQTALPNQEIEINQAALWAKAVIQNKPKATIGILCPDLPSRRKQIERILSAVFEPQSILPDQSRYAAPFNFSAGNSLSEQPVIHHAFEILGLNKFRIPFASALTLLHSPFIIATEAEREGRVLSELYLRNTCLPDFTLMQIKNACEKHDNSPQLHQALLKFSELYRHQTRSSKKCLPESWGALFLQQLNALGWPGERRLDSVEYQQVKQWESALQNFSSYNDLTGRINFSTALQLLKSLSQNIIFQAKTPDSPIQVLGLLEGASLHFSHLWVMGLDDKTWPPAPRPNPLLPVKLQKTAAMPHASADRELAFATSLMKKITHSAKHIIFSYSTGNGDEILRPSKLIEAYPALSPEFFSATGLEQAWEQANVETSLLSTLLSTKTTGNYAISELRVPEAAPRVSSEELSAIAGGTGIFKNQVLCPFKAFATHRLKARPLNEASTSLSAIDRGNILHLALERLWKQLKTQKRLLNLNHSELQNQINQASAYSLEYISQQRPDIFGPVFKNLETKRLNKLINNWLDVERCREPFEVIGFEQQIETEFEGIPLKLRIDRIDQTADGAYHLIDYKTGTVNIKNWLPETFSEPQLPLYAVIESKAGKPVKGIHYAQVSIKKCFYSGLPANLLDEKKSIEKEISAEDLWQNYLNNWQYQLSQLAEDFIAGKAEVLPRVDSNPCRYCDLGSLCRINEMAGEQNGQ